MPTGMNVELLRTIHRLLRQQADLNDRMERGPRRLRIAKTGEEQFAGQLNDKKQLLQRLRMQADEKQLQLTQREGKIEEFKAKRNACESNKEYQLLNDAIGADQQANSVLADEILELLERVDQTEAQIGVAQENLKKAQTETKRVTREVDAEQSVVKSELDRVTGELEQHQNQLPSDIRAEFLRRVRTHGENTLAAVDENTCGHCNQVLNSQQRSELMMSRTVYCCSCGSLLYLSEKQSV